METCNYCGRKTVEGEVSCRGCGSPLVEAQAGGSPRALEVAAPVTLPGAIGWGLSILWGPFAFTAVLSVLSKEDFLLKHLLMLPGVVPVLFLGLHGRFVSCYVVSAIATFAVVGIAAAVRRCGPKVFKLWMIAGLLAFCVEAFLTVLWIRA
jgi:hypothetical protein